MTDVAAVRRVLLSGGVALLPTDTVYGLMAALDAPDGVSALYRLKKRPLTQPCQVLFFGASGLADAMAALPPATCEIAAALLPGPVTVIVPDTAGRYRAAAGATTGSVGLRAPSITGALATLDIPLIATSANHPGGPDAASVEAVPADLRNGCTITVDTGVLTPTPSAVVDLRGVERNEPVYILRPGSDPDALVATLRAIGVLAS